MSRLHPLFLILLGACGSSSDVIAPSPSILLPLQGASLEAGAEISLVWEARDDQAAPGELEAQ